MFPPKPVWINDGKVRPTNAWGRYGTRYAVRNIRVLALSRRLANFVLAVVG